MAFLAQRGIRLPAGINLLCKGNEPRWWVLISRHPRWSITWLWAVDLHWGERPGGSYWERRWGVTLDLPDNNPRGGSLALGPIVISLRRQHAMPRAPRAAV